MSVLSESCDLRLNVSTIKKEACKRGKQGHNTRKMFKMSSLEMRNNGGGEGLSTLDR